MSDVSLGQLKVKWQKYPGILVTIANITSIGSVGDSYQWKSSRTIADIGESGFVTHRKVNQNLIEGYLIPKQHETSKFYQLYLDQQAFINSCKSNSVIDLIIEWSDGDVNILKFKTSSFNIVSPRQDEWKKFEIVCYQIGKVHSDFIENAFLNGLDQYVGFNQRINITGDFELYFDSLILKDDLDKIKESEVPIDKTQMAIYVQIDIRGLQLSFKVPIAIGRDFTFSSHHDDFINKKCRIGITRIGRKYRFYRDGIELGQQTSYTPEPIAIDYIGRWDNIYGMYNPSNMHLTIPNVGDWNLGIHDGYKNNPTIKNTGSMSDAIAHNFKPETWRKAL